MQQVTKKQRIGLTVSAVWILIVFVLSNDGDGLIVPVFTFFGILPVLIGWAVWWIRRAETTHSEKRCRKFLSRNFLRKLKRVIFTTKNQTEEICDAVTNGQSSRTNEEQAKWFVLFLLIIILISIILVAVL